MSHLDCHMSQSRVSPKKLVEHNPARQEQIGGPCTEMLGDCIHSRFDMEENGDRFESLGFHETSS